MRRRDRNPSGAWIRAAWLDDEVLQIVAAQYESITGQRHPTIVALESGAAVIGRVYELPDVLGDHLRAQGCPVHTQFRLTSADDVELARAERS